MFAVHDPTDGKEDQGEAISAKPFPEKTAEYPDRINSFQEKSEGRASWGLRVRGWVWCRCEGQ
jgi:hypothetical protein